MKNFAAKLKGMNYKQAVIDHGEKLFLGVIGLFVLICLAGTSWSRYDKEPKEFTDKVAQGEAAIRNSAWTAERAVEFKAGSDIMQAVERLHSPLEPGRFEYSTNWFWPMYPATLKISEPKWLAPLQPIADGNKVVVYELPLDQVSSNIAGVIEDAASDKKVASADDDDEFKKRPNRNEVGGAGVAAAPAVSSAPPAGADAAGGYPRMPGDSSSGPSGQTAVHARGMRFIAVRAVFPLADQLDELVKAMQLSKKEAADLVEFLDFELERQVAKPGDQPWSGEWEKVDIQATLELLDRIEFDTELVDLAYTDSVFTMPLPKRAIGSWTKYASHPLIKALNAEQALLQEELAKRMVEKAEQEKKDDKTAKKGFAPKQHDGRSLRGQFAGQMNGMMTDMKSQMSEMPSYSQMFGSGDGGAGRGADPFNSFQTQMAQTGNGRMVKYLLFRYFDFQVTPGNAYRYRVRMILRNPNFKQPVEALVDESIAAGEVRPTPWSEPTPHVVVPQDERIFLAKADKAKIDTGLPAASLDVYQWFSEAGTTIAAKIEKLQLGQFVGGHPKTEVFRPANDTLREEEITVFTGSLLADAAASPTPTDFDFAEHADLKLDPKKLKQLGVVDRALLVDRYGQLLAVDSNPASDDKAVSQKTVDNERRDIRARIKERPESALGSTSDLDKLSKRGSAGAGGGYPSGAGGGYPGGDSGMMPGGGALRKTGAKGSGSKKATKGPSAAAISTAN